MATTIDVGLRAEVRHVVSEEDTAIAYRSGDVPVLATPRMIALCEQAAIAAVAERLPANLTTVGMRVQVDHLQPTAVGRAVVAEAVRKDVEGRRLTFAVSVHDDRGLIGAGKVTRVVIDAERFMLKAT